MKEQLSKMKNNMLIIIDQYKEKVNLATGWGQVLRDEQTINEWNLVDILHINTKKQLIRIRNSCACKPSVFD